MKLVVLSMVLGLAWIVSGIYFTVYGAFFQDWMPFGFWNIVLGVYAIFCGVLCLAMALLESEKLPEE